MIYNIFVLFVIICLFLYSSNNYEKSIFLKLIFFSMFVIFSIEFYTTQDYSVYYNGFLKPVKSWEHLYLFLVKLFNPFGFIAFNSVVSAFEMFTLYFLFRKIIPPKYIWVGVIFLILNTNYFFLYMNLKRQFFAMSFILWVAYFLFYSKDKTILFGYNFLKSHYVYAVICFACATQIHSSAYFAIVLFLLSFVNKKISLSFVILVMLAYAASFTFSLSKYMNILNSLISVTSDADYYSNYALQQETYETDGRTVTLLYQSFDFILLLLLLLYNKKFKKREYPLLLLSVLSLILFNVLYGNFYRLNFYFSMFNLFTIPLLLSKIKNKYIMVAYMMLVLAVPIKLYYNAMFSKDKVTYMTAKYQKFYTIFDSTVDKRDLNTVMGDK